MKLLLLLLLKIPNVIKQQTPEITARTGKIIFNCLYFGSSNLYFKEARNSFFGLGVYLLKSKFRIEGKLRFP